MEQIGTIGLELLAHHWDGELYNRMLVSLRLRHFQFSHTREVILVVGGCRSRFYDIIERSVRQPGFITSSASGLQWLVPVFS